MQIAFISGNVRSGTKLDNLATESFLLKEFPDRAFVIFLGLISAENTAFSALREDRGIESARSAVARSLLSMLY